MCPLAFLLLFILADTVISEDNGNTKEGRTRAVGCMFWMHVFNIVSFLRQFYLVYHRVLSSFLICIFPICHLFTLTTFKLPMNISHLDCCVSPSYLVSFPLVSPLFQIILYTGWSNRHIWPCHSQKKISGFLVLYTKLFTYWYHILFLTSYFTTSSQADEIPAIWNYLWLPVISCFFASVHTMSFSSLHCLPGEVLFLLQSYSVVIFSVKASLITPGLITNCCFWAPLALYIRLVWYFFSLY